METGYLVFIDVLGFRTGVISHNYEKYISNYINVLDSIVNPKMETKSEELDYIVFSDSIVITSKGNTFSHFSAIIHTCSKLYFALIKNNIPIRGSISYGSFTRKNIGEKESNIFIAGPALIEAYELEKRQKWVGISLCPSVNDENYDFLSKWEWSTEGFLSSILYKFIYKCSKIPLENEETIDGFIIFPRPTSTINNIKEFSTALNYMRLSTIDKSARLKYSKTLSLLQDINITYPGIFNSP